MFTMAAATAGPSFGPPVNTSSTNTAFDYYSNIMHPDKCGQVQQRPGSLANSLPENAKQQIVTDFQDCLTSTNPELIKNYGIYRICRNICYLLLLLGFILLIIDIASVDKVPSVPSFIPWIFGICGAIFCSTKMTVIRRQWQSELVSKLPSKMEIWKTQFPQWVFSIIYPVNEYRRSNKGRQRLVATYCYVRVTQGPVAVGWNETMYATSADANANQMQVVTQQVMAQPQQQQQVVMVQTANGMQQGTTAMVNGQQVILVQQQPQQQQQPTVVQVVQQQPVQVVQQQQQQEDEAPPAYNADIYSAPPAYNDVDGPGNETNQKQ